MCGYLWIWQLLSLFFFTSPSLSVCGCVCVCKRQTDRERERFLSMLLSCLIKSILCVSTLYSGIAEDASGSHDSSQLSTVHEVTNIQDTSHTQYATDASSQLTSPSHRDHSVDGHWINKGLNINNRVIILG